MQFGVFGPVDSTLNFILGSAAVIKIMPDGTRETIAQGIGGLAPSFTFDATGNLYVTDLVFGQILKYDLLSDAKEAAIVQTSVKAYPNPTTDRVNIEYELARTAPVMLDIFDLSGRRVAGFDEGQKSPGAYSVRWNGTDANGRPATSGMYVYRLTAGSALASGLIQVVR